METSGYCSLPGNPDLSLRGLNQTLSPPIPYFSDLTPFQSLHTLGVLVRDILQQGIFFPGTIKYWSQINQRGRTDFWEMQFFLLTNCELFRKINYNSQKSTGRQSVCKTWPSSLSCIKQKGSAGLCFPGCFHFASCTSIKLVEELFFP